MVRVDSSYPEIVDCPLRIGSKKLELRIVRQFHGPTRELNYRSGSVPEWVMEPVPLSFSGQIKKLTGLILAH